MDTISPASSATNARSLLLPYALAVIASMAVVQIVIAVTGGQITLLAAVLTAVVALGIAIWILRHRQSLNHVRFGPVIAHSIAYVAVTASFNAHAAIRALTSGGGDDGLQVIAGSFFASQWFGATLIMSSVWGAGLLVHLIGSVLGRGWED